NKIGGRAKAVGGDFAHARHDAHAGHYIGTVGSLDANLAERRIDWAHDIGHDVHGAATHSAVKESAYFVFGRARVHPVVRRTYIVLRGRGDKRKVLGTGDVIWAAAVQVAMGKGLLVERLGITAAQHFRDDPLILCVGAVAENDAAGLGQLSRLVDPIL